MDQFGGDTIEKLPLSATPFESERSGMQEHFVLPSSAPV